MITKAPENRLTFRRDFVRFKSARDAFAAFLDECGAEPDARVLLPSFIGWSPREGSGVFDPVSGSGLPFDFYRVNERLRVDVADFATRLRPSDIVVLIHYFGYVDPANAELVRLARKAGAVVLEDEAHAMFTDLACGGAGRDGDAAIFSLHKMLPFEEGGLLVWNGARTPASSGGGHSLDDVMAYDLVAIAERRRANAAHLLTKLSEPESTRWFEPLWPTLDARIAPQTFPILVHRISRFALYERLQAEGFGVVALYHTLIPEIDAAGYPDAHRLAATILNLPVHQDVDTGELDAMLAAMNRTAANLD